MSGLLPVSSMPLAYEGAIAVPYIIRNYAPTSANNTFNVPTLWIDPADELAWILLGKPLGVADWALLASAAGDITGILTPDGNTATPVSGLVDFLEGSGMSITSSGNQITFNSTGSMAWNGVTTSPQTLVAGNGYVVDDNSSQVTFSLPATADFGSTYAITGLSFAGWTISQRSGQSIIVGEHTSMTGTGGSVTSDNQYDTIFLLCVDENTTFKATSWSGNLTVV